MARRSRSETAVPLDSSTMMVTHHVIMQVKYSVVLLSVWLRLCGISLTLSFGCQSWQIAHVGYPGNKSSRKSTIWICSASHSGNKQYNPSPMPLSQHINQSHPCIWYRRAKSIAVLPIGYGKSYLLISSAGLDTSPLMLLIGHSFYTASSSQKIDSSPCWLTARAGIYLGRRWSSSTWNGQRATLQHVSWLWDLHPGPTPYWEGVQNKKKDRVLLFLGEH